MSLRSVARRAVAAVAVALAFPTATLHAQQIAYGFSGSLPSGLGGSAWTLAFFGSSVSDVQDISSIAGAPAGTLYATMPSQAFLLLGGLGAGPLDAVLGAGSQYYLGAGNGLTAAAGLPFSNAVGFLGLGSNGALVGLLLPTTTAYDLKSNFSYTGTAYAYLGAQSSTSFDPSQLIQLDNTTFEAQITSTPEPASLALMSTGLVALGGVVVRRRKQPA
jgi:hypothetical protein